MGGMVVSNGIPTFYSELPWEYDDGGREAARYKGKSGDCVARSITIATGRPYQEVYDGLNAEAQRERRSKRKRGRSSARDGVHKGTIVRYLKSIGWEFVPTMQIGSGCTVHLRQGEMPERGRFIVSVSRHYTAVIDGMVRDVHDPTRGGMRCVYGYWQEAAA